MAKSAKGVLEKGVIVIVAVQHLLKAVIVAILVTLEHLHM